ncbi:hypothetical protein NL676_005710 [Syzygium grande]|nr:hypothetical protein NL676_005710 [Syzygium grande]
MSSVWVLTWAYPRANRNSPVPEITGISRTLWNTGFRPSTVMPLPLYLPDTKAKFMIISSATSSCDAEEYRPWARPTSSDPMSGRRVRGVVDHVDDAEGGGGGVGRRGHDGDGGGLGAAHDVVPVEAEVAELLLPEVDAHEAPVEGGHEAGGGRRGGGGEEEEEEEGGDRSESGHGGASLQLATGVGRGGDQTRHM